MDNIDIAFDSAVKLLGFEPVKVPTPSQKSIQYGVSNSPEYACFPFKTFLGTYKDCVDNGAKVMFTIGGKSLASCHLEDYAKIHEKMLREDGNDVRIIDFASAKVSDILSTLQKLNPEINMQMLINALTILVVKLNLQTELEDNYSQLLFYAPAKAEAYLVRAFKELRRENRVLKLYAFRAEYNKEFKKLKLRSKVKEKPIKIALVGDIYMMNSSPLNHHIIKRLAEMGVIVKKTISLADMANGIAQLNRYNLKKKYETIKSKKYLSRAVGGFAHHTIMESIKSAEEGYDGLIHIYPFTCMPELVARSILPKISEDYKIPILYLPIDEQTGEAGTQTRMEAFVDLLKLNSAGKKKKRWF